MLSESASEPASGYDNGAAGSGDESPVLKISRPRISKKQLRHELKAVKAELARTRTEKEELAQIVESLDRDENDVQERSTASEDELNAVRAELEKTRMEKEELSRILESFEQDDNGFHDARTSTRREEHNIETRAIQAPANESLLLTMTNISLSNLNIPECVPAAGETEINKRDYDHWKSVVNASMNLIQAVDESTKIDLFRIKAGSLLLELLDGITTQPGMPDPQRFPYSNAIARLDAHFGSRAYMLSQRNKLANMVQKSGESNIQYVKRVAAAAKLCTYKPDEEFEAISRSLTRGSIDSRVRTLAYRVLTDGGNLNELIDQVRIREVELENENDYQRLHQQRSATVAAVSRHSEELVQRRRGPFAPARGYIGGRGRGFQFRDSTRSQRSAQSCWRCLSTYHAMFPHRQSLS